MLKERLQSAVEAVVSEVRVVAGAVGIALVAGLPGTFHSGRFHMKKGLAPSLNIIILSLFSPPLLSTFFVLFCFLIFRKSYNIRLRLERKEW